MRPQSPIPLNDRRRSPDLLSRPFISSSSSYSSPSPSPPSSPLLRKHSPDAAPLLPPPPPHHHHHRRTTTTTTTTTYYLSWLALAAFTALSIVMLLRTLLLTAAAATPCAVSAACYHGFRSAFSFDAHLVASSPRHAAWMGALRNDTLLAGLSIPGTHDTMTYAIGSDVLQCQNWNLSVQLAAGLRYFDVRARLRDDQLRIYHGDGDTGFGYQDVLLEVFGFLARNPSEAVVLRVKQEGPPVPGRRNNTLTFEEAFNYHLHNSSITAKQAARHMHDWDPAAPLPALGDLRSKVLVLQDFPADHDGPANKYGVAWDDGRQMVLEDRWIVPDVHRLRDKWTAIREALERAAGDVQDNKALYLSHVSASVGVLPIEAAAGPRNGSVVGMNDETGRWLENGDQAGRTGIVIFDFPGKRAIEAVLARNAAYNA
ncbi:hypothetical protein ARSEF4850_002175 [Beauveria asiatica]